MKFEFNQGVSNECIDWLWENVGQGNVQPKTMLPLRTFPPVEHDDWFYERIQYEIRSTNPKHDSGTRNVPTITVKDPKLAMLFALRWL